MALIAFNEKVDSSTNKKYKVKKSKGYKGVNLLLEPSPKQWWEDPDALVAFNIPRISARLERLMGTNVVRLTDRKYMKELRQRIDEDYRVQLANRIRTREIKELERERNLILEGKTDNIPDELSADPIFVVNQRASVEINKRRAKLKTNRERNAERLLRQGLKWEKERLRYERQEVAKQRLRVEAREQQKALEEQYMTEDATRGLNLLRINDIEWQDCEQSLVEFLEAERNKMKARSWAVPTPFSSDPLDIQNIMRARKKKREEKKIESVKSEDMKDGQSSREVATIASEMVAQAQASTAAPSAEEGDVESQATVYLGDDEASDLAPSTISIIAPAESVGKIKAQRIREMEEQMNNDVLNGCLTTKEQYADLRYSDPQITKLHDSKTIRALYQMAEKIIICDTEEEVIPIEEAEIEEEEDV